MSIYADACYNIALNCIADSSTFSEAFGKYIESDELGYYAARERWKFDPYNAKRYGGSQRAWDEKVWRISLGAWKDAMQAMGKPGKEA